jgi:hypothetical protein
VELIEAEDNLAR